jgi:TPR repeat protein
MAEALTPRGERMSRTSLDLLYNRLPDFFEELREQGFAASEVEYERVISLLAWLTTIGRVPESSDELGRVLAPIIARNADEQAAFPSHLQMWLATDAPDHKRVVGAAGGMRASSAAPRRKPGPIIKQLRWYVASATTAIVAIALWRYLPTLGPGSVPALSSSGLPTASDIPDWLRKMPFEPLPTPWPPFDRTWRWYLTEYDWQKWSVVIAPWLFLLIWIGVLFRSLLAYLRRQSEINGLRWHRLKVVDNAPEVLSGSRLFRSVQPLRRQQQSGWFELDVEETVRRTAEAAGRPVIAERERPVSAEFLILLERRSEHDHLAAYGHHLTKAMQAAGLFADIYSFDRDPRLVRAANGRALRLQELLQSFADHRLLLLSDGACCFNPVTGLLEPWAWQLRQWSIRILLTPRLREEWDALELVFEESLGFLIETAIPESIAELAARISGGKPELAALPQPRARTAKDLFRFLADRPRRWMSAVMPGDATVNALLRELRRGLDVSGFTWLVGLAVYPELRWPLTLQLGWTLRAADGRSGFDAVLLLVLSRLPWLRSGYMPEWLRSRMLAELGDEDRQSLRRAFDAAFAQFNRNINFQLDILRREPGDRAHRRSDGVYVDFLHRTQARNRFADIMLADSLTRLIRARPFRQLIGTLVLGSIVAAILSVAGLAFLPINECDLLASNSADPRRVGVGVTFVGLQLRPAALEACAHAAQTDPTNARLLYEYARSIEASSSIGDAAALRLYENAAGLGYPMAINALVNIYEARKDFPKSSKYISELEHIYPAFAEYQRARTYVYGWGVPLDNETALKLSLDASKDGVPSYLAAILILKGLVNGHSIREGTQLLQLAAEAGDEDAAVELGLAFEEGLYNLEKDPRKHHVMNMKAAALGSIHGLNNAGVDFDNGIGVEADPKRAATLFLQSVHLGNIVAVVNFVKLLERSESLLPELRPMMPRLTEYAAERNDPDAQLRVAAASEKTDPDRAVLWYKTILANDTRLRRTKDARDSLA